MNGEPLYDAAVTESATSRKMTLHVGRQVTHDVVSSTFDQMDSPWAVQMQSALLLPERSFVKGWATMHEVSASPVAWEVLARWCRAQLRDARYGDAQHERTRLRRLMNLARKIDRELDRLANHPAYHHHYVMGLDPVILPVYQVDDGPLAPTPARALKGGGKGTVRAGVLLPERVSAELGVVTRWTPQFT